MTPGPRRLRVLIAEDSRDARESLCALIGQWGHDCQAVADGPEALALAVAFSPHVLLVDLSMPGMDGYEVARRVREQPGLGKAYLVACTGFGDVAHVRRAMEAGFDGHLLKGVDPEALRQLLEQRAAAQAGKVNEEDGIADDGARDEMHR